VQVFELRVTEAFKRDEFYKMRSKVGIAFQFDELVGGHAKGRLRRKSREHTLKQGI